MKYPKIIITGPFNSGKTELVKNLSDIKVVETEQILGKEKTLDKYTTTVVMDFGRVTLDNDTIVYLFGTPGQDRFDFMWEILSKNMIGFIVMIDSTQRDLSLAKDVLKFFKEKSDVPYIIAANKQDLFGAFDNEYIRKSLNIPKNIEIVPCIATDRNSCINVLIKILEKINC